MEEKATDTMEPKAADTVDPKVAEEDKEEEVVEAGEMTLNEDDQEQYPLQYAWTMWFNPPNRPDPKASGGWTSNVKAIISFGSVVDFWRLVNNLLPPSKLQIGSNYHMFKEGIEPEWEHPENTNGGKWVINFSRRSDNELKEMDDAWLWTILALVGEYFEDSDQICGVVVSPRRKENRLALWTKDARNADAVKRIGEAFKRNVKAQVKIGYQVHADCVKHGTSFRNEDLYSL